MPVKMNIKQSKIQAKMQEAFDRGLGILSAEILYDCNRYCKEDTGMLIASSFIHSRIKEGILIWQTPYARRQYYEIRTASTDVNRNATWKWVHFAKSRHRSEWAKKAEKIVRMIK